MSKRRSLHIILVVFTHQVKVRCDRKLQIKLPRGFLNCLFNIKIVLIFFLFRDGANSKDLFVALFLLIVDKLFEFMETLAQLLNWVKVLMNLSFIVNEKLGEVPWDLKNFRGVFSRSQFFCVASQIFKKRVSIRSIHFRLGH